MLSVDVLMIRINQKGLKYTLFLVFGEVGEICHFYFYYYYSDLQKSSDRATDKLRAWSLTSKLLFVAKTKFMFLV